MATTTSLQYLHHHHNHQSLLKSHHSDTLPSTLPSSLFFKTLSPPSHKLFSTHFSLSSTSTTSTTTTTTTTTTPKLSFDLLQHHLSSQNFRQADEETRRLLIVLAGEATQKRGYVFFSEVQFISESDLQTIDKLWRQYSNDKFGYSVQKRIWETVNKDFTKFFIKVGWMKLLDSEVVQYNYKSFPTEFIWELKDDTPEGHLPLTNALRGTQLFNSILMHPAFQSIEVEENEEAKNMEAQAGLQEVRQSPKLLSKTVFKTDYSF